MSTLQLAINCGAGGLDIGYVEDLPIGATGKASSHRLTHNRAGAVAASDVTRCADLFMTLGPAKAGGDALAGIGEADQFGPAFTPSSSRRAISSLSCSS